MMEHHAAFGLDVESLDIVIVDDSKTVLTMLRSMISALKVGRVRSYDRGDVALQAILDEPPNVILTDLAMSPMTGMQLIKMIRQTAMAPLCFVPIIVITAHATQKRVGQLFELGAHHVLAKPIAANVLQQRILSLSKDNRIMRLEKDRYVIDGMREMMQEKQSMMRTLEKARQFHEETVPQAKETQRKVDQILNEYVEYKEEEGRRVKVASQGMRMGDNMRNKVSAERPQSVHRSRRTSRFAGIYNRRA